MSYEHRQNKRTCGAEIEPGTLQRSQLSK